MGRLKTLYKSKKTFEEIIEAFPKRTVNAVRQKASRLGLKRPSISHTVYNSNNYLRCYNGEENKEEYLFKCGGCGGWMHVYIGDQEDNRTIACNNCNTICKYVV
jgi:hypothetical protein